MPRYPDPKAKTNQLIIQAKNESEASTLRYFKNVCRRDGLELRKEVLNLIEVSWKKSHPPPGNPQLQIVQFSGSKTGLLGTCGFHGCHSKAVAKGVFLPTGILYHLCADHKREAEGNRHNWRLT